MLQHSINLLKLDLDLHKDKGLACNTYMASYLQICPLQDFSPKKLSWIHAQMVHFYNFGSIKSKSEITYNSLHTITDCF